MTARWPVHPRPLSDETLSSWLLRVARANASSLPSWLAAIEGRYDDATSLDTTSDAASWARLAEGADLHDADEVRALTFADVEERLRPHGVSRWLLSIDDRVGRPKHGYCAVCLAADHAPYLRRAWRLEWVRWCPVHACRMTWSCRCGAMLAPWKRPWDRPFASCWSCGRDMVRGAPKGGAAHVAAPRFVMDAIRQATARALTESDGSGAEVTPFPTVWCLQKWAEIAGRESWPSWVEKLGLGASRDATPPSDGDEVAWSFALAWHLATGPLARIADLSLRHQSTFNRATELHCPPSLVPFQRRVHTRRNLTSDDVEEAVAALIESDMAVTYLAVAEVLGVSANRISANAALRAVVDRAAPVVLAQWCAVMRGKLAESRDRLLAKGRRLSRANLADDAMVSLEAIARFERETGETFAVSPSEEHERLVAGAIATLRAKGERITAVAVAKELGRERSFIEKRPDLQRMVRAARDAKPTTEEVRRACGVLRERDEAITILGVARVLGRGRETIERSEPLRAIVDAERAVERTEMEAKIRSAAKVLEEYGRPVTVAAVCRQLGLHRPYIEKRGRLREIVMRVRRR
ncbi:MAG: TniQ family protein [Polyangiales bacterium]